MKYAVSHISFHDNNLTTVIVDAASELIALAQHPKIVDMQLLGGEETTAINMDAVKKAAFDQDAMVHVQPIENVEPAPKPRDRVIVVDAENGNELSVYDKVDHISSDIIESAYNDEVVILKAEVIRGHIEFRKAIVTELEPEDEGEDDVAGFELSDWKLVV